MDCSEFFDKIKNISEEELKIKLNNSKSKAREKVNRFPPEDRYGEILKLIKDESGYAFANDIKGYILRLLEPDCYMSMVNKNHTYSNGETFEYDPYKNGENIIKHGISFNDVISFSGGSFGTLLIPIKDEEEERLVAFSSFFSKEQIQGVPPERINKMNYVISILTLREQKYRFISSRFLGSSGNYQKDISQSLKDIIKEKSKKESFVNQCVQILEKNLINNSNSIG